MTIIEDVSTTSHGESDYFALNAMSYFYADEEKKTLQLHMDRESARQYFLTNINPSTVFFHTLEEKLDFLFDNEYYEKAIFDQYNFEDVKDIYKLSYAYKFRFPGLLGAVKFYTTYALKTFDGKRYLERFEDRVSATALYLARGDVSTAESLVDEIMTGRYQPATPTFLNAAKAQRGELVSCFEAGTPITTENGSVPIEKIRTGDKVLTHAGRFMSVTSVGSRYETDFMVTLAVSGNIRPLRGTGEHPVLVSTPRDVASVHLGDGATENLKWVPLQDVKPGDYVALGVDTTLEEDTQIQVSSYLRNSTRYSLDAGVLAVGTVDAKNNKRKGHTTSLQSRPVRDVVQLDEKFGRFIGYYLAEGYTHRTNGAVKGVRFTFGSHEEKYIEDVIALSEEIFGLTPTINVNKDGSTNVAVWSQAVGDFFLNTIGTGFDRKTLPEIYTHAPADFLWGLLIGAMRGDGTTVKAGVIMDLVNPALVQQLFDTALRTGLAPTTRIYTNQAGNPTAQLIITQGVGRNTEYIYAVDKTIEKFRITDSHQSTVHKRVIDGHPMYRVRSVDHTALESPVEVFNLEVEDDHTYVANGYVVHNCFLVRTEDNMESISNIHNAALQMSKRGGGVAFTLTNLREAGAPIKKIEGQSSGVVPVMKMLEDAFSYSNQLGARPGAGAVYLNAHHPDILTFLDTKRENADEKSRIKTLSLAVVIPDITFHLAKNDEDMYLFSPYDVERVMGKPMTDLSVTEHYRAWVEDSRIRKTKIKALRFFEVVSELAMSSGYPFLLFEDTANRASNLKGRINMSNLCSEILQVNTASTFNEDGSYDHVGRDISCNLGSMNIAKSIYGGDLGNTVHIAVRALTAVSDLSNVSAVPSIAQGNAMTHAIGLGQMNLAGFLASEKIHYDSPEAVDFTSAYFAAITYYAVRASATIAKERGETFDGFESSKYASGEYFEKYISQSWAPKTERVQELFKKYGITVPGVEVWTLLRDVVAKYGIYNGYLQAVPPTGSISYINHSTASIHPISAQIEIRKEGALGRIYYPAFGMNEDNREFYRDSYHLSPEALIDVYAAATEHVDQGLSCTLFINGDATTRDITKAHIYAWKKGLKTIYYTRVNQNPMEGTQLSNCVACEL